MPRFTPGELAVMQILWEHGEQKPADIQQRFPEPIKNPALRSYLGILLEKGHVTRRRAGRAFVYKAATPRRAAFRKSLREMVDAYCDGSMQTLLMNLLRSEKLTDDELLRLKRLADEGEPPPPSRRGTRR